MIYRNAPNSELIYPKCIQNPNAVLVRIKIQGLKNVTFWENLVID